VTETMTDRDVDGVGGEVGQAARGDDAELDVGMARAAVAEQVAETSVAAMTGRIGLGLVIDRLNQRITSAVSFASQVAGLASMLVLPDTPIVLAIGCVVFGLSVGNVITLPSLIVQREFAARSFGLVIGLSSTIGYVALAFGPVLLGVARDVTGGYGLALGICIALQLAAAALVLLKRGA